MSATHRIRLISHSESFEVRYPDGRPPRYFYFEDEPTRRQIMGRMTREEALQTAQASARAEQARLENTRRFPPASESGGIP